MNISDRGVRQIAHFEGFSPKACKCVPTEKYLTIGYGHYGKDVKAGQTITQTEALKLLKKDAKTAEKAVNKYYKKYKWSQEEFDALCSFAYNVGNIDGLTQKGTRSEMEIANKMLLYNKSGGVVLKGLTNRRKIERNLYIKGVYTI